MNTEQGFHGIAVPRFLYADGDGAVPVCDAFGFWRSQIKNGTQCHDIDEVLKLKGGLIVGEGDSGKTFYLNQLKSRAESEGKTLVLRLREYRAGEFQALERDVEAFLSRDAATKGEKAYLFIDGADEREEFLAPLMRLVRRLILHENLAIWIATRRLAGLEGWRPSLKGFPFYKLAPLRYNDIWALANAYGCDGN